jgi:hypothetical protein
MSERTELAQRVLEEVKQHFEEYGYDTSNFSIYSEESNISEENEYFVSISTHGNFTGTCLGHIFRKLAFSTEVHNDRLIINCCVKNSRYV